MLRNLNHHHIDISYFEALNGKTDVTIVCIHGLGSSQNVYYPMTDILRQDYNVVLFDNEGAGRSPISKEVSLDLNFQQLDDNLRSLTIKTMAEDAILVSRHVRAKKIVLIGHSMGAMIANYILSTISTGSESGNPLTSGLEILGAILFAPVHPNSKLSLILEDRIKSILQTQIQTRIIFNTGKITLEHLANKLPEVATGPETSSLTKGFIRELIMSSSPEGYIANCKVIAGTDPKCIDYNKIKVPVLIIIGEFDITTPWDQCVEVISKGITGSKIEEVKGAAHWIMLEKPDESVNLVTYWIKSLGL